VPATLITATLARLKTRVSRRVVEAAASGRFAMEVCPLLLAELAGVLSRPKFERWRGRAELDEFVALIARAGEAVSTPTVIPTILRDPSDDYLVALARSAGCSVVCSGDDDLLAVALGDVEALSPGELLRRPD
jgi:predicted nucleic acid-binding protein